MKILAVDDEKMALNALVEAIQKAVPSAELFSTRNALEAVDYTAENQIDVAFLDISMRELSGVDVAQMIKKRCPNVNIIFSTGYDEYREVAFDMHASGYITKPITEDKVRKELDDLRHPVEGEKKPAGKLLKVNCFGNFDVTDMGGKPIYFDRQKAKELFAYLVFRHGASCTIKEVTGILFEDSPYDKKTQLYLQKIVSSMMQVLKAAGAEQVVNKKYNCLGVNTDLLDCDYLTALQSGDKTGYLGEFMAQYSWAEEFNWYLGNN